MAQAAVRNDLAPVRRGVPRSIATRAATAARATA